MAINMNGTSLTKVFYNGTNCGKVTYNGTTVFIRVDSASGYSVSNQASSSYNFSYQMTMPATSAQQTGTRVTVRSDRYANNPNEGTYYRDVYRGLSADSGSVYKIQGTSGLKYIRVWNYYDYGGTRYYGTYWDTTYQYSGGCSSNCSNSSCCDSSCDGHTCSNCSHCSNCSNCPHGCADCSNSGGPVGNASC